MRRKSAEESIADVLRAAGVPVIKTIPGDDVVDGCVEVTALVHVQVPTCGSAPGVVRQAADEGFIFYGESLTGGHLVRQVQKALQDADQEQLQHAADAEDAMALTSAEFSR